MTRRDKIYSGPGGGKSEMLTNMFVVAAQRYGPENVAAITFTKTAAEELRQRLAVKLGIKDTTYRGLSNRLRFVGTIHSIAYRMLGVKKQQMANEHFKEFADYVRIEAPPQKYSQSPEYADAYWFAGDSLANEAEAMLKSVGAASHQGISVEAAFDQLPVAQQLQTDSGRIAWLASQYRLWKREADLLDFEDLLVEGAKVPFTAKILFLDEAQDCSKLQWSCVNAWAERTERFIAAGDPYQAIYLFQGGSPEIFLNQPGNVTTIPISHRMDQRGVEFARSILWKGGYPGVLADWRGEGGEARDGTSAYLGRTHLIVSQHESNLQSQGVPYLGLNGWSPYTSRSAEAYRALQTVEREGSLPADRMKKIVAELPAALFPRGTKAWVDKASGDIDWPSLWPAPKVLTERLPHYWYFKRIEKVNGERGMYMTPKVYVGTGHSAKGREFDRVYAASSWAFRPAREMMESVAGMKAEALVAYVMGSRARLGTEIVEGFQGERYNWP